MRRSTGSPPSSIRHLCRPEPVRPRPAPGKTTVLRLPARFWDPTGGCIDEATSALDPQNSRLVLDAARQLAAQGSVVVIAHNLDTIKSADQILVLDRGSVVQQGTHEELHRVPGVYRDLVRTG